MTNNGREVTSDVKDGLGMPNLSAKAVPPAITTSTRARSAPNLCIRRKFEPV